MKKQFCTLDENGLHYVCELLDNGKIGRRVATYQTALESWQDLQKRRAEAYAAEKNVIPNSDDAINFSAAVGLIQKESQFAAYPAAYAEAKKRYPALFAAYQKAQTKHD